MKRMMIVLVLTIPMMVANAQMSESKLSANALDQMITRGPEYLGGEQALSNYFQNATKYPEKATRMGREGIVVLEFYILADGSISEEVSVSKSLGAGLDEEALRLVKDMSQWLPALQNGAPVKVKYALPIRFELR